MSGTPNAIATERGIKIGSLVERLQDEDKRGGQRFIVTCFDEDGDPYGQPEGWKPGDPGVGSYADRCHVVAQRPNCAMLAATRTERGLFTSFVIYLEERGIFLCEDVLGEYAPTGATAEDLAQEFFGIDKKALEEERRALVES